MPFACNRSVTLAKLRTKAAMADADSGPRSINWESEGTDSKSATVNGAPEFGSVPLSMIDTI